MVKRLSVVSLPKRSFSYFGRQEAINGNQVGYSRLELADVK
jgi:hypothetical protein